MGDVVGLYPKRSVAAPAPDHEAFLVKEGLELLADYRTIDDPLVRAAIRSLIKSIAQGHPQTATSTSSL